MEVEVEEVVGVVEVEGEQEKEDLKRDLAHSLATLNGSGILPCKVNLRRI